MRTDVKQVILVRHDLKMSAGKIGAQVAHASMKVLLENMNRIVLDSGHITRTLEFISESPMDVWTTEKFTKICLKVNTEEELLSLYKKAQEESISCSLVTDAGLTVFNGIPTNTCVAIGPHWNDVIDKITGHLKLLR